MSDRALKIMSDLLCNLFHNFYYEGARVHKSDETRYHLKKVLIG
jgi:hypothetical protein